MTKQFFDFNQVVEERAIENAKGLTFNNKDFVSDSNKIIAELNLPLLPPAELIELISVWNKIIGNSILEQMGRLKTKDQ